MYKSGPYDLLDTFNKDYSLDQNLGSIYSKPKILHRLMNFY